MLRTTMLDVVVDVGELAWTLLVSLQDLCQIKEATLPGHLCRGEHVDVPEIESLPGSWTVQQGAGELLQTVGGGEVEQSGEL